MRKMRALWKFWVVDEKGHRGTVVTTEGWTWFDARETAATLLGVDPQAMNLKWEGTPFS